MLPLPYACVTMFIFSVILAVRSASISDAISAYLEEKRKKRKEEKQKVDKKSVRISQGKYKNIIILNNNKKKQKKNRNGRNTNVHLLGKIVTALHKNSEIPMLCD